MPNSIEGHLPEIETAITFNFGLILDTLADPVVAADASNRIVYLNSATERLLGWSKHDLLGQELAVIQPERFRAAHVQGFERYMATRIPRIIGRAVRVPALHRDGSEIDIELTLAPLTGPDGRPLIVASLRDLRERVELERQMSVTRYLRASTAAAARLVSLLDLEHVLKAVVDTLVSDFDSTLARVWLYEPETHTLRLRASAGISTETERSSHASIDIDTYSFKIATVARTRSPFIKNGLEDDPQFDQQWIERERIAAIAAFPLLIAGELRGVLVHFTRRPIPDEVAQVLASFAAIATAAINDVQLLEQAELARAEAVDAVRIRDEFLSTVSHDLKNPLAAIKGRAQMLRRRAFRLPLEEAERFADGLESIDGLTTRMTQLINDLVDVTRLRIGAPLDLHHETVDLMDLVRQVAAEQQETTNRHTIHIESALNTLTGEWDRSRLERVLTNLLNNAIKYTPHGGDITVAVSLETADGEDMAVICVSDPGIGIPAADLPHVFGRYHRAANAVSTAEGTGVGLAGARRIVEHHHGTIEVASIEGEGTTFTVRLPVSHEL